MPWVKAARRISVVLEPPAGRDREQARRGERDAGAGQAGEGSGRGEQREPARQQVAEAHQARRDGVEGLHAGRRRAIGAQAVEVASPQEQAGGQGEHQDERGGELQPARQGRGDQARALGQPGAQHQRRAARVAPGGDALVGGEDARLRIHEGEAAQAGERLRGGVRGEQGERAGAEQRERDRGLARHPRAADVAEDVERAPRPADLEPDAEQPERHEDEAGGELRTHLDAGEAGEPGEQDEPAAAAAADEVAGGAPVPVLLQAGRGLAGERGTVRFHQA